MAAAAVHAVRADAERRMERAASSFTTVIAYQPANEPPHRRVIVLPHVTLRRLCLRPSLRSRHIMAMLLRQWKVDATYSSRQLAHFTRAQLRLHAYYCFDTWRLRAARLAALERRECRHRLALQFWRWERRCRAAADAEFSVLTGYHHHRARARRRALGILARRAAAAAIAESLHDVAAAHHGRTELRKWARRIVERWRRRSHTARYAARLLAEEKAEAAREIEAAEERRSASRDGDAGDAGGGPMTPDEATQPRPRRLEWPADGPSGGGGGGGGDGGGGGSGGGNNDTNDGDWYRAMEDGTAVRRDGFPGTPAKSPAKSPGRAPFLRGWPPPRSSPVGGRQPRLPPPAPAPAAWVAEQPTAAAGALAWAVWRWRIRTHAAVEGEWVRGVRSLALCTWRVHAQCAARATEVRDGMRAAAARRALREALYTWLVRWREAEPVRVAAAIAARRKTRLAIGEWRAAASATRGRTTQRKVVRDRLEFGRLTTPALSVAGRSRRAVAAAARHWRAWAAAGRRERAAAAERWRARETAEAKLVALASGDSDLSQALAAKADRWFARPSPEKALTTALAAAAAAREEPAMEEAAKTWMAATDVPVRRAPAATPAMEEAATAWMAAADVPVRRATPVRSPPPRSSPVAPFHPSRCASGSTSPLSASPPPRGDTTSSPIPPGWAEGHPPSTAKARKEVSVNLAALDSKAPSTASPRGSRGSGGGSRGSGRSRSRSPQKGSGASDSGGGSKPEWRPWKSGDWLAVPPGSGCNWHWTATSPRAKYSPGGRRVSFGAAAVSEEPSPFAGAAQLVDDYEAEVRRLSSGSGPRRAAPAMEEAAKTWMAATDVPVRRTTPPPPAPGPVASPFHQAAERASLGERLAAAAPTTLEEKVARWKSLFPDKFGGSRVAAAAAS